MTFSFRPAQRSEAKPLIGLHAESGGGKTYGALVVARGFVGQTGKIGMIETEGGRGESYSNPQEYPELAGPEAGSNYSVLSLRGSFSPEDYGKAITAAEQAGLDALIVDSASHEWEGPGGVLDQAQKNTASGKSGMLVWQKPKIDHATHFMLRLIGTPIPLVIVCMRSKYRMEQVPKKGGGMEWVRSTQLEPKQSDDILYEMFLHGWLDQDHKFHLGNSASKSLREIFKEGEMLSIDTGRRMAAWARGESSMERSRNWSEWGGRAVTAVAKCETIEAFDELEPKIRKDFDGYKDFDIEKAAHLDTLLRSTRERLKVRAPE